MTTSTAGPPPEVCTVGIRLQGPMQSWALIGRGAVRGTHTRPTKAGVIGLIANALGRDYTDTIDDLAQLRFGVRIDDPGILETDYHTAGGGGLYYALPREAAQAPSWWGTKDGDPSDPTWMAYAPPRSITEGKNGAFASVRANANITKDQYLADASFLAAVEGTDIDLLHRIAAALTAPARALFLGRKAYGPAAPLLASVTHEPIEDMLRTNTLPDRALIDIYIEPHPGQPGQVVHDQPVTFNGPTRRAARLEAHYPLYNQTSRAATGSAASVAPSLFDDVYAEGTTP